MPETTLLPLRMTPEREAAIRAWAPAAKELAAWDLLNELDAQRERVAQLEAQLAQVRAQLETALVHSNFWEEQAARNARTIMDCGGLLDVTPGALAGGFLYDRISKLIANEHACQRRAERLQEDLERALATGTPPVPKE